MDEESLLDDPMGMKLPLNNLTSQESLVTLLRLQQTLICAICHDVMFSPFTTSCGHSYCYNCLYQWLKKDSRKMTCPNCRKRIKTKPILNLGIKQVGDILIKLIDSKDDAKGKSLLEEREKTESDLQHDIKYSKELFPNLFDNVRTNTSGFIDREDGVRRCPACQWEVPGREIECRNCGLWLDDLDEYDANLIDDLENDEDGRHRTPLFGASQEEESGEDLSASDEIEIEDDYDEELDGGFIDDGDILSGDPSNSDFDDDLTNEASSFNRRYHDFDFSSMEMDAGSDDSGESEDDDITELTNRNNHFQSRTTTTTTQNGRRRTVTTTTNGTNAPVISITSSDDNSDDDIGEVLGPVRVARARTGGRIGITGGSGNGNGNRNRNRHLIEDDEEENAGGSSDSEDIEVLSTGRTRQRPIVNIDSD